MSGASLDPGNPEWARVQELFFNALEQPARSRTRWLNQQTPGEQTIRAEVESLLAALEIHEELSRTEPPAESGSGDLGQRLVGEFCGPYRLDCLIGQGGMAWVYEGTRVSGDFRQRAAVKVLPAVFGEALNERFRVEKQILAELTHPGIAALLDGGVNQDGLSYLVMEYVEGERITGYAASHALSRRDRIQLFLQVSAAVEFAHGRRIVHRDIKPANILVTAAGQPKLLDFGIARLLDQEGAGQATLWRAHTPGYASPEQVRGEAAGVTTDVYQLGVLLTELLTGKAPEKDQPFPVDAQLESGLRKTLGAGLAAIVGKARRYDPAERYTSAAALAEDLDRYLRGLPVLANRGSWVSRAAKFARRHRGRLLAATLAAIAGAGLLYQIQVRRQERVRRANELYTMVLRQGTSIWENVAGDRPELAYEMWRGLRDDVEALRRDDPGNPTVSQLLGQCYLELGQLAWFRYGPSLMDTGAALESYQSARSLLENPDSSFTLFLDARMYGSDISIETGQGFDSFREVAQLLAAGEARRTVDARLRGLGGEAELASFYDMLSDRLGGNMHWTASDRETQPRWRAGLAALRPSRASDTIAAAAYQRAMAAPSDSPSMTRTLIQLQLGRLQYQAGARRQGILTLQEALTEWLGVNPATDLARARIAGVHMQLSNAEEGEGQLVEALRDRQQALAIMDEQLAKNPHNIYLKERVGVARIGLGRLLARSGRSAEAAPAARPGIELLDENARPPRTSAVTLDLAAQRWLTVEPAGLRDPRKALELAQRAVRQTGGQMPPYLETLAFAQEAAGFHEDAARSARQAVAGYRKVFDILRPVFESQRYPEAGRVYAELRRELDEMAGEK